MATIPGAYPVDPATPDMEEPASDSHPHHHHHHRHEHHQRNKLHKSNEPRSHGHTESGVGLVGREPVLSLETGEYKLAASPELTDEGAHSYDYSQPLNTLDSDYKGARLLHGGDGTHTGASLEPEKAKEKANDKKAHSEEAKTSDASPPYWGSLPKALGGGIYNTVMGHGSPAENHEQHHNLPQKSTDRARVAGAATDYPGGGVYNSVAGHGSQDEESKRHGMQGADAEGSGGMHTRGDTGPLLAAPLPNIAEEKEKDRSPNTAIAETGRSDIARGFLSETATMDDVLLASSMPGNADNKPASDAPIARSSAAHDVTSETHPTPQRAFPLSTSTHEGPRHDSSGSDAQDRHDSSAATAGSKPNKLKKHRESSSTEKSQRNSRDERGDDNVGALGGLLPQKKDEKVDRRKSSDGGSPKNEKRQHKILGIFRRRKDDEPQEDVITTETTKDDAARHRNHRNGEAAAAAAAAAGAGTYSILHHHNDDNLSKDQRSSSEPMGPRGENHSGSKRMSVDDYMASTSAGSAAEPETEPTPAPPTRSAKRLSQSPPRTPTTAQNDAPTKSETPENVQDSTEKPSTVESYGNTIKATAASAAGVVAGLGATYLTGNQEQGPKQGGEGLKQGEEDPKFEQEALQAKQQTPKPEEKRSSLPSPDAAIASPAPENPRAPPPTPLDSLWTAKPRTTPSERTPSPKSANPPARITTIIGDGTVTSEPGEYNTLASGTASGVKAISPKRTSAATHQFESRGISGNDIKSDDPFRDDSEPTYNVLPSGTPSGVKIKSWEERLSMSCHSVGHSFAQEGDGQYNVLGSGTPSGVDTVHRRRVSQPTSHGKEPERNITVAAPIAPYLLGSGKSTAEAHQPTVSHPASVGKEPERNITIPEPMPSHPMESHEAVEDPSPELTAFPTPEQAEKMSPEVLPEAYTASAPRSSSPPKDDNTAPSMESEGRHSQAGADSASHSSKSQHTVDPALAAATEAWTGSKSAASAAPAAGNGNGAGVVHKCQHCGGENDISSYFTKENMAKMNAKHGSTGSWWHNWSST